MSLRISNRNPLTIEVGDPEYLTVSELEHLRVREHLDVANVREWLRTRPDLIEVLENNLVELSGARDKMLTSFVDTCTQTFQYLCRDSIDKDAWIGSTFPGVVGHDWILNTLRSQGWAFKAYKYGTDWFLWLLFSQSDDIIRAFFSDGGSTDMDIWAKRDLLAEIAKRPPYQSCPIAARALAESSLTAIRMILPNLAGTEIYARTLDHLYATKNRDFLKEVIEACAPDWYDHKQNPLKQLFSTYDPKGRGFATLCALHNRGWYTGHVYRWMAEDGLEDKFLLRALGRVSKEGRAKRAEVLGQACFAEYDLCLEQPRRQLTDKADLLLKAMVCVGGHASNQALRLLRQRLPLDRLEDRDFVDFLIDEVATSLWDARELATRSHVHCQRKQLDEHTDLNERIFKWYRKWMSAKTAC